MRITTEGDSRTASTVSIRANTVGSLATFPSDDSILRPMNRLRPVYAPNPLAAKPPIPTTSHLPVTDITDLCVPGLTDC
jgi:hypothetical protein